jgi:hypothetical protein
MEPSLTADAASTIAWTLKQSSNTTWLYINRLGLPQPAHKKRTKGPQTFDGDAAGVCKALVKTTSKITNALVGSFRTKDKLRECDTRYHLKAIADIGEPLLSQYGPRLWSATEPHSTRICQSEYPQYLKYNDDNDRERFVSIYS